MADSDRAKSVVQEPIQPALQVVKAGSGRVLPMVTGQGSALAIVWPGMGAQHRTLHRFDLGPWAKTVAQQHAGEAVYVVLEGEPAITDLGDGAVQRLTVGAMVHLDPGTRYSFRAGEAGAVILGGPCPPDPSLYLTD